MVGWGGFGPNILSLLVLIEIRIQLKQGCYNKTCYDTRIHCPLNTQPVELGLFFVVLKMRVTDVQTDSLLLKYKSGRSSVIQLQLY